MIAKHLEGFVNYLLTLAGVPTQLSEDSLSGDNPPAGSESEGSLQPAPVKNFLHYL